MAPPTLATLLTLPNMLRTIPAVSVAARSVSLSMRLVSTAAKPSTFKTFAEYRSFIVKKDPETLKLRHEILFKGRTTPLPENERELGEFKSQVQKVAYK